MPKRSELSQPRAMASSVSGELHPALSSFSAPRDHRVRHEVSVRHWLRFRAAVTGDPTLVVDRLLAVLDKHDVVRALDR